MAFDSSYSLHQAGLNPQEWDVVDNGDGTGTPVRKSQVAPSITPKPEFPSMGDNPAIAQSNSSSLGAFSRGAATSVLPTGAGLAGGMGAAGITASLLGAPETGGLSLLPLLAGVVGGLGSSYGMSKIQDAVIPNSYKQQLAEDAQQHPIAAELGGLAPSVVAFNPIKGAMALPGNLRNLAKIAGGGINTVGAGDLSQLLNMGVNVGTAGGQDIYSQMQSPQPFSVGQLAKSMGISSVLNEPTAIGKSLGFHSGSDIDRVNSGLAQDRITQALAQAQAMTPKPEVNPLGMPMPEVGDESRIPGVVSGDYYKGKQVGPYQRVGPLDPRVNLGGVSWPSAEGGLGNPETTTPYNVNPPSPKPEGMRPQNDRVMAELERANQDIAEQHAAQAEIARQLAAEKTTQTADMALELKQAMEANQGRREALSPKPLGETPLGRQILPDYSGTVEHDNAQVAKESPQDLVARQMEGLGDKYQTEPTNDIDTETWAKLPAAHKQAVKDLAARHGIKFSEAESLINPATGKEVLGQFNAPSRTATVNTVAARADTAPHEIGHGYIKDLLESNLLPDQQLAERAIDIFGKGDINAAEEKLQQALGVMGSDRIKTATGVEGADSKTKSFLKDFVSRWKNNLGMANGSDVIRHLSQRQFTDAPYGMRGELAGNTKPLVRAGELYKDTDLSKFSQEDVGKYNNLVSAYKAETDENKKLDIQKRIEELKNTYGGLPPTSNNEPIVVPSDTKNQTQSGLTPEEVNLGNRNKESSMPTEEKLSYSTFGLTRSVLDNIRKTGGTIGQKFADAASKYYQEKDNIKGELMSPIEKATSKLSPFEKAQLENTLVAENRAKKSYREDLQTEDQKTAYDTIRESLLKKQQDQIKDNQPVRDFNDKTGVPFSRAAQIDPFYYPNKVAPKVLESIQNNPNSATAENYRKDFIQHQVAIGNNEQMAEAKWESFLNANLPASRLGIKGGGGAANYFKANREAQGVGLPDSMMRPGLEKNLSSYFSKVANDRSFYRNIESKPEIASALGLEQDAWGNDLPKSDTKLAGKDVYNTLEHMKGEHHTDDTRNVLGLNKVATSLMLGPLTNAHIVMSSLSNAISYALPHEVAATITHSIGKFRDNYQDALRNGYAKKEYSSVQNILDNNNTFAEKLGAVSQGLSNLSGRALVNHVTKGLLQGAGDYLVRQNLSRAISGDTRSREFIKQVDPTWNGEMPNEEGISKLASNFAGMIHGNHDARSLPRLMLTESALQPFMSLASWNVAQTNNFFRQVITPAKAGNFTPLIMSTLGAGLGGYVLKKMREKLSDKAAPFPSLMDLHNTVGIANNPSAAAYNLMAMASMSGYGGILSMLGKDAFDIAYKNRPQGAAFPLDEVFSGGIKTATDAITALSQPGTTLEDFFRVGSKAAIDLARENVQIARLAHAWVSKIPGVAPEQEQMREVGKSANDIRNWRIANGLPYEAQEVSETNPYIDSSEKAFRRTGDIQEASKELPDLINEAITKANGNPEVMKSELGKLKHMNYETMPSLESTPLSFFRYLDYLKKTQGEDVANKRMMNYIEHNAVNKVKSSMVPSL